jgi:hypothetical protein
MLKSLSITLCVICCSSMLLAQPYVDIVTLRGAISPDAGVWNRNNIPVKYFQYIAGVSVPIVFKRDSSKLVLSAYTERWQIEADDIADNPNAFQSVLGAVTYIKPISTKWSLAGSIIPRWNGNANDVFNNSFQLGGSLLGVYRRSPDLTYRFGVYYNSEFFGPFIIPLLGIDWKISNRDNLFGILPQILTYEHKVSDRFYWGAAYRMFNNSYRIGYLNYSTLKNYMRIVEMQLMLSADLYLTKKIVFNVEAGHSLFRRLNLGTDESGKDYYSDDAVNDGFVIKAGFLYRMRLR